MGDAGGKRNIVDRCSYQGVFGTVDGCFLPGFVCALYLVFVLADRFEVLADRFEVLADRFEVLADRFKVLADRFEVSTDSFKYQQIVLKFQKTV